MKKIVYQALFLLLLTSCAPPADSYIGFQSNQAFEIPIKLAYKAEIFSQQELGIKEYPSAAAVLKALLNEDLDLAILPLPLLQQKTTATSQLKKLAYYQREGIALASADSHATEVAVVENSLAALLLEKLIQKQAVDFHLRYFSNEAALQKAYNKGDISAICHKIPQLFEFENLTHKTWLSQYFGRYPNSLLLTTEAAFQKNPAFFQEKLQQISSAVQLYNQDLPLANAAAARFAKIASSDLEDFIYQMRFIISLDKNGQDFEKELWAK